MELSFLFLVNLILLLYLILLLLDRGRRGSLATNEVKERSQEIIAQAIRQANRMLVEAELKGIEIVAREKLSAREAERDYQHQLQQLLAGLDQRARELEREYQQLAETLEKKTLQILEQELRGLSASLESQLQKELSSLQKSLLAYRRRREEFIDQQVFELLTRTLELTLGKTLDLSQHTQLVLDALKKAKKEGFFETG